MAKDTTHQPTTPEHEPLPPIAAQVKAMESPTMVRTVQDVIAPTDQKISADIEAAKLMTAGQRDTSWKWEETQASLALMAARSSIYTAVVLSLSPVVFGAFGLAVATELIPLAEKAFLFLVTTAASITAYYFLRTNSHKIGGVQKGDAGR